MFKQHFGDLLWYFSISLKCCHCWQSPVPVHFSSLLLVTAMFLLDFLDYASAAQAVNLFIYFCALCCFDFAKTKHKLPLGILLNVTYWTSEVDFLIVLFVVLPEFNNLVITAGTFNWAHIVLMNFSYPCCCSWGHNVENSYIFWCRLTDTNAISNTRTYCMWELSSARPWSDNQK